MMGDVAVRPGCHVVPCQPVQRGPQPQHGLLPEHPSACAPVLNDNREQILQVIVIDCQRAIYIGLAQSKFRVEQKMRHRGRVVKPYRHSRTCAIDILTCDAVMRHGNDLAQSHHQPQHAIQSELPKGGSFPRLAVQVPSLITF
jgi:hypothetical protein